MAPGGAPVLLTVILDEFSYLVPVRQPRINQSVARVEFNFHVPDRSVVRIALYPDSGDVLFMCQLSKCDNFHCVTLSLFFSYSPVLQYKGKGSQ